MSQVLFLLVLTSFLQRFQANRWSKFFYGLGHRHENLCYRSRPYAGTLKIDATIHHFDFAKNGPDGNSTQWIGIYELSGDSLRLSYRNKKTGEALRPKDYESLTSTTLSTVIPYCLHLARSVALETPSNFAAWS